MKDTSDNKTKLLTPNDVAERLGISRSGVYRLTERRVIPFFKVGGSLRFQTSDLDAYLAGCRIESIDENVWEHVK